MLDPKTANFPLFSIEGVPLDAIIPGIRKKGYIPKIKNEEEILNLKKIIGENSIKIKHNAIYIRSLEKKLKELETQNPQTESLLDKFTKGDANYLTEEEREFLGI